MAASHIQNLLRQHQNLAEVQNPRFFKTAPGDYAAHDKFLGIPNPTIRTIAHQFSTLSLAEIAILLTSPYNEERLLALFIVVHQYRRAKKHVVQRELYDFYCTHIAYINNWNLVDASAHEIIGAYLFHHSHEKHVLIHLAQSNNLWHRRIAIIATLYFIRKFDVSWTYDIAKILLHDTHDLIHKAVGWMLREAGKKEENALRMFLDKHAATMPRTMLRYAVEKFSAEDRVLYLKR